MKSPSELENMGLFLRPFAELRPCTAIHIVDAQEGEGFAQRRTDEWHYWRVMDGRFVEVMSCDRLSMIQRLDASVRVLGNRIAAALPVPPPAAGKGKYRRR